MYEPQYTYKLSAYKRVLTFKGTEPTSFFFSRASIFLYFSLPLSLPFSLSLSVWNAPVFCKRLIHCQYTGMVSASY